MPGLREEGACAYGDGRVLSGGVGSWPGEMGMEEEIPTSHPEIGVAPIQIVQSNLMGSMDGEKTIRRE